MSAKKNTLYNMAYRVFSILLPLATAPYLSRTVGQAGVGLYSYSWNLSYIFVLIGLLGLENYGVRAISRVRDQRTELDRTFSEIYCMQRWVALPVLLLWIVYVLCFAGEEKEISLSLTMMSISCLVNLDWCLMGLDQFRPIALRNTAVKLLAAACVFLFIHGPEDLWIYGLAWSAATLVGCLLSAWSLRGKVSIVHVSFRSAFRHFLPCMTLFVSVLAVSIYRTMDKVMVGGLAGMAENGLYENAEKIVYCLSGFISAFGTVMLPRASHLLQNGKEKEVRTTMLLSMHLILCMTAGMAFGLLSIADTFIPLFYGPDFVGSVRLIIPLGFTLIMIGFANVIRTQWILPHSADHIVVRSVVAGAVINLLLNILLIPRLGAMGAVIGTLFAELTVPVVQGIHLRHALPYPVYLRILSVYMTIGFIMTFAVRSVTHLLAPAGWWTLAVYCGTGFAIYMLLCLVYWRLSHAPVLRLLRLAKH